MEREYILNREIGKIELHFEKSEYDSLPDQQKRALKSNFNWSRTAQAWVSKARKDLYWARKVAAELGFTRERREGELLSFAEQIERKQERAEARAERYEQYAQNAEKRGEQLQSGLGRHHGDIAFFTQPIHNTPGGRRFANYVKRLNDQFEKGMEEYRKSSYFRERAEVARETAASPKLKDRAYLDRKIEESKKSIRGLMKNLERYGGLLDKLDVGEPLDGFYRDKPREQIQMWFDDTQDRLLSEIDKQGYFENRLEELGGIPFSRENIKPGYLVSIRGYCMKVVKANPKTVEATDKNGFFINYRYAEIDAILKATEEVPKEAESHPFEAGQILGSYTVSGSCLLHAYQILKRTDKTITLQEIEVADQQPRPGAFVKGSRPFRKKPVISAYTGKWRISDDRDWPLYLVSTSEIEKESA